MLYELFLIKLPKVLDHWDDKKLSPQILVYERITIKKKEFKFK